jgi:hypothetical protein
MFKLKTKKSGRAATATSSVIFSRTFLDTVGKVIRDEIVKEAKAQARSDRKKKTFSEGQESDSVPEGIPNSPRFFASFKWRIVGTKVEIYSDWPWINQIVDGRDPYKMTWLTQEKGVKRVPFTDPTGKVKILSTPANASDAWLHPGFSSHNFIQEGWKNAAPKVRKMYAIQTFKEGIKKAFG